MSSPEVAFRVRVREMAKEANSCNRTWKGGPHGYDVFYFSGKRSRRATSAGLSAIDGSVSRDCGLCGCPSGYGQPLHKTGWEADECLQDVERIVCIVFGIKYSRPLLFPFFVGAHVSTKLSCHSMHPQMHRSMPTAAVRHTRA